MKKITVLLVIFLLSVRLFGQSSFQPVPNVYVGISGTTAFFLAGDFDGQEYYSAGDDYIFPAYKPNALNGYGWGIQIGYQNSRGLSFEMGVVQTYHGVTWQANEDTMVVPAGTLIESLFFNSILFVDLTQHYLLTNRFQPYLRAGVGFIGTSSKRGYVGVLEYLEGGFAGVAFRGGAGIEIFISPLLSVCFEGVYQYDLFTSVEWQQGSAKIDPRMAVHEIKAGLWGVYHYGLPSGP